jgi:hypothetical protein
VLAISVKRAVHLLREASWLDLLKCAYLIFLGSLLAGLAVPGEVRSTFVKPATLMLVMMLFIAKDCAHAPEAFARFRSGRAARHAPHQLLATLLPPGMAGWFRLEREMWRGAWAWLCRLPNPARRPNGVALHYLDKGSYRTAAAIVLVAVFGELPVSHLIASLMVADPALELRVHLLLGIGSVYALAWVAGDRWHVKSGYHVLADDELDLKVGARAAARIPLGQIVGASPVNESRVEWCRRNGVDIRDTAVISPIDKPNLVLALTPGAQIPLSLFGVARHAPQYVFLYLDRPALLLARLAPLK